MALCPHCQNNLPENATGQCPNCGGDLGAAAPPPQPPAPPPTPPVPPAAAPPPSPPGPPGGGGVPPAGGAPRRPRPGIPWDDRDRIGIATALIETTKQILGAPNEFFRVMPTSGGLGSPLLYAVIIGWIGVAASAFYQALFNSVVGSGMAALGESPEIAQAFNFAQSWGGFIFQLIFGGVLIAIGVFITSGIIHVMLLILGGAGRDFEATFRVVSFAEAPYILGLLPFCGQLIALVWWIVICIIGLVHAQRITGGKAAAAVLLPIVFICCCCFGLITLVAGSIGALAGAAAQ